MERKPSPKDNTARLLRDPEGYFAESRRWATGKARLDVAQELADKEKERKSARPHLARSVLQRLVGVGHREQQ